MESEQLGVVVRGSLSKGLELKLDPGVSPEGLRAGMFAIARGQRYEFFSLLTDLELCAAAPEALDAPPPEPGSLLREVLAGESIYVRGTLRPHLMVDLRASDPDRSLLPVKTIPGHFTPVRRANAADVDRVFGSETGSATHFHIGAPIDMEEIPLCMDLARFTERSNGIFGKSGTGKTFLTRMILCGIAQKQAAVNLVFDMHGEYGWQGTDESRPGRQTKGLKMLYPERVQVFTLDPRSSIKYDGEIRIPYSSLEPEDVLGLQHVINLTPTAAENIYLLEKEYGREWFVRMLDADPTEVAKEFGAHEGAVQALRRRLVYLQRQCQGFLKPDSELSTREPDAIERIIANLEKGVHTVIDFGRYSGLVHYVLTANLLTRRIDEKWREKTELNLADPHRYPVPHRLVITIEEAHKFLEPGIAEYTTFGRIARELRKYNVTLLVVDQRPSQIEKEVLSQIGTRICCLLDDEKDVEALLSGAAGAGGLRSVLASLDTRQQALIFGHALPMPVVVKTRTYDEDFWKAMGYRSDEERVRDAAERMSRDFPDD